MAAEGWKLGGMGKFRVKEDNTIENSSEFWPIFSLILLFLFHYFLEGGGEF